MHAPAIRFLVAPLQYTRSNLQQLQRPFEICPLHKDSSSRTSRLRSRRDHQRSVREQASSIQFVSARIPISHRSIQQSPTRILFPDSIEAIETKRRNRIARCRVFFIQQTSSDGVSAKPYHVDHPAQHGSTGQVQRQQRTIC
jgi:hypothetical protein